MRTRTVTRHSAALLALAAALAAPSAAQADAVLDWNGHAQSTIFFDGPDGARVDARFRDGARRDL